LFIDLFVDGTFNAYCVLESLKSVQICYNLVINLGVFTNHLVVYQLFSHLLFCLHVFLKKIKSSKFGQICILWIFLTINNLLSHLHLFNNSQEILITQCWIIYVLCIFDYNLRLLFLFVLFLLLISVKD